MGDYIRGKKAYTKWDADSENIDIEYRPDAQKNQAQEGWLSGTKGKVIKVLLVLLCFCFGLIVGFFIRRGIHEVINRTIIMPEKYDKDAYSLSIETETQLLDLIKSENIKNFLKEYTAEPHIAGKPSSQKFVEKLRDMWETWGLDNVHIEKFNVLLSYPSSNIANTVRLISQVDNSTGFITTASESGDDELHPDLRPYLAYSLNSSAQGKLVYANYGRREDFDQLRDLNISVADCVVIMRLGKIHRINKIKFAEEFGARAALLYPDPSDFVSGESTYPNGLGLPGDSVIRGTLNNYPGDPTTPMLAATESASPVPHWQHSLPLIPVQPISYNNAQKFMSDLAGPPPPNNDWKGGLNISYSIGPGHKNSNYVVNVSIHNELKRKNIYNLLGTIQGRYEPDRYVIFGNHHDSWTNGTGDPGSGLAAFMEMVRAFAKLKESGWQPGRTLVFACWDGEEFGKIGSTEWVELHNRELMSRAVAYINTDAAIIGRDSLVATGSPLLQNALTQATKAVLYRQHEKDVVYHHWLSSDRFNVSSKSLVGILSGDSDYVSFMSMYGISSLHLEFVGNDGSSIYPLFNSAYDNFEAFVKFIDPHFEVSFTMAQLLAALALQLTENLILPMNVEDYGISVWNDYKIFVKTYGKSLEEMKVSLKQLDAAVEDFKFVCSHFHNNFSTVDNKDLLLGYHEYNDRTLELERALLAPHWEVNRLSLRHAIYGPHPENLDEGVAFPQLVDAVIEAQVHEMTDSLVTHVRFEISQVIASLRAAVDVLKSSILNYG